MDDEEFEKVVKASKAAIGTWLGVDVSSQFMPLSIVGDRANFPQKVRGVLRSVGAMVEIGVDFKLMAEWLKCNNGPLGIEPDL